MPISRQVLAQRVQEATWALEGTPIGWRSENGGERRGVAASVGFAGAV